MIKKQRTVVGLASASCFGVLLLAASLAFAGELKSVTLGPSAFGGGHAFGTGSKAVTFEARTGIFGGGVDITRVTPNALFDTVAVPICNGFAYPAGAVTNPGNDETNGDIPYDTVRCPFGQTFGGMVAGVRVNN